MLPDRISNPGPLTNESGAVPIALRGPARRYKSRCIIPCDIRILSYLLFCVGFVLPV